ncbi:MAG: hypothetical protein ACREKH_07755 [Candidatus Rokuibacteriota bacterium]
MIRLAAAAGLLVALAGIVSCGCNCYYAEDPEPYTIARENEHLSVEVSGEAPVQYLAWCIEEDKAVSAWVGSQGTAESAGSDHVSKRPGHAVQVLWRQTPDGKGVPSPFKGNEATGVTK